jgi:hypothetical protein
MILKNTRAMLDKTLRDIDKIIYVVTFVVQVLFLGFYGYSIYNNINHLSLLIIYSVLAVISIVTFIYFVATYSHKRDDDVKSTKKVLRFCKYGANGVMLSVKIVELFILYGTLIDILLVAISCIMFIFQIILELIRRFAEEYFDLIKTGFMMDVEPVLKIVNKFKEAKEFVGGVKDKVFDFVDAPLEGFISRKRKNEQDVEVLNPTKTEKRAAKNADLLRKKKNYIKEETQKFENEVADKKKRK